MPWVSNWQQFEALFRCLSYTTMIDSIKDLHWDILPSPHFGTVEVRVMDTPLTLSHAVNMAGLIEATAHWLLTERPFKHQEKDYLLYNQPFPCLSLWAGRRHYRSVHWRSSTANGRYLAIAGKNRLSAHKLAHRAQLKHCIARSSAV